MDPDRSAHALKPERLPVTCAKTLLTWERSMARHRPPEPDEAGFRVLFYHRVSDDRDLLAVRPQAFRRQMELLADRGCTVVDLATAWDALTAGTLAPRTVVLNFDDGYRDVAENAVPVLRELGFTATVFIAPGLTDGTSPMPWYRVAPPLLSWDEMRALQADGLVFEPHSMTHRNLPTLDDAAVRAEIEDSRATLRERLGTAARAFCYPAGLAGERERVLATRAGIDISVSCEPGRVTAGSAPQWLPRIGIGRYDRLADLRAKLDGAHDRSLPGRALYQAVRYGRGGRREAVA